MTKRKYSGLPKHVANAYAKFLAWSAEVDTVDERSVDECRADCVVVPPSGLPKGLADRFAEFNAWSATVEQSAQVHQKWLNSKVAYRRRHSADDVFREKERERAREWRRNNPDKVRAQKEKSSADNYFRPCVAIDSEGQDYAGDDIWYQGVRYPRHDTYLWGAAADDGHEPVWLTAAETHGTDKRPLRAVEILDWLLDLRRQYGNAVFIMFSFRYDIAQLFKHFGYFKHIKAPSIPGQRRRYKETRPRTSFLERIREPLF